MMSSYEVAQLAAPQPTNPVVGQRPDLQPSTEQVDRFEQIFRDASATPPAQAPQPVAESQGAREDTLKTLELDGNAAPTSTTGDTILGGLSKLREVFDAQQAKLADIAYSDSATGLITAQIEVVKYSMLVDITSKLTGKATQSFDTLMKGQ